MKFNPASLLLCLMLSATVLSADARAVAAPDTVRTFWGPFPAPTDSNTARPETPPAPLWQTALLAPYRLVGVPVTLIDKGAKAGLLTLDRLGAFEVTEAVVRGVPDPLGNFWLPDAGFGDSRGLQVGVVGQRPDFPFRGMRTKWRVETSTKHATLWTAGALLPLGPGSWFDVGGGSQIVAEDPFYGIGVGTRERDRSVFQRKTDWAGVSWRRDLARGPELLLLGHYSAASSEDSDYEAGRALDRVHAGDIPFGYGWTSAGFTGGAQLGFDTTDQSGRPAGGTRMLLFGQLFSPTDDSDAEFWTQGCSAEAFLGLGRPQRTLAVKAWYVRQIPWGDDPVPVTRLLRNRAPYQLRGYSSSRFRATGMTGVSAEYRWPAWIYNHPGGAGVDAYLFADAGQPFDDTGEIALRRLVFGGGGGLRLIGRDADFSLRLELGVGREGVQVRLTASQLFQFIKAGFYEGSEPIPVLR